MTVGKLLRVISLISFLCPMISLAQVVPSAPAAPPAQRALLLQLRSTSLRSQRQFQQAFWAMQSSAAAAPGTPLANGPSKVALITTIKANTAHINLVFTTAGVYSTMAKFALNTAISFPGFKGFSRYAGLISEIATAGAGATALYTASTNNTKGANLSAAMGALVSGLGSVTAQKGQTNALQVAFADLNKATADVAVLQFIQQDYNLVGPHSDQIISAANALKLVLPSDPATVSDQQANDIANQYMSLMKLVDAWYNVDLPNLHSALATQVNPDSCKAGSPVTLPSAPPYDQPTMQEFCQLMNSVEQAESGWKDDSLTFDNATAQAQSYLIATQ